MVRIAWGLIGLDVLLLITYFGVSILHNANRSPDGVERSFSLAVAGIAVVFILLSALPLWISHAKGAAIFSAILAAIPLIFIAWYFIASKVKESRQQRTPAEVYYTDKTQRAIATAITDGDTATLKRLIQGQNLNLKSESISGEEGLDYLQFALRLKNNYSGNPFNEEANAAVIRVLVENGCPVQPEMGDVLRNLSPAMISYLIDAGADVNLRDAYTGDKPLFKVIGLNYPDQNEVAKLLISKGADVNALNKNGFTPVMYAAYLSGTFEERFTTWSLVRYMVEKIHVETEHTNENGYNLHRIINDIVNEAKEQKIQMPDDFTWVVNWLKEHPGN